MLIGAFRQSLIGSLQDPLRTDVHPGAGRHLAVHHQILRFELPEVLPRGPLWNKKGVCDQNTRRSLVGRENCDRFARLDEKGLVVTETLESIDDGVVAVPVPRRLPRPTVHDQLGWILRVLGIEVVHQHPHRRFLEPSPTGDLAAARSSDYIRTHFQLPPNKGSAIYITCCYNML